MLQLSYTFPLDPGGEAVSNKIEREVHEITADPGRVYNFIIPRCAPYFGESVLVKDVTSGLYLTKNIDFVLTHAFEAQSNTEPFKPVYGSLLLTNTAFTGRLELTYQTLGGPYTLNEIELLNTLANVLVDPRTTTWESVAAKPYVYDPLLHTHHSSDLVGMNEVVDAIREIAQNITSNSAAITQAILVHRNDPDAHAQYVKQSELTGQFQAQLSGASTGFAGGTDNVLELNQPGTYTLTNYAEGLLISFVATYTNTGPVTAKIGALSALTVYKDNTRPLAPGDIKAGCSYQLVHRSAQWFLLNPSTRHQSRYVRIVATAGQTEYRFKYVPGTVTVKKDGLAVNVANYTQTSGNVVVLNAGVVVNTLMEFTFEQESGKWVMPLNNSYLASGIQLYPDNALGPCTYFLPFNPSDGEAVEWVASDTDFETNPMTFNGNGKNIMTDGTLVVNESRVGGRLIYSTALNKWRLFATTTAGV
jgi:hypothetical protein